jgi:predicted dehydrogenase
MRSIGIGIVGGGYMGKAHAVAMQAVGSLFDTALRPRLEMIATSSAAGAAEKARALGFSRSTGDWRALIADPAVEAVVIASPQQTHREIALAAFAARKPVLCEKPLGANLEDSRVMLAAAEASGVPHMVGFNYIRAPASMMAREIIAAGDIGRMTFFRAEHTEDFLASPDLPSEWRTKSLESGAMGDLSPHIINAALAIAGPIRSLIAEIETVHHSRPGPNGPEPVENDDQAQITCRFKSGSLGSLFISRVATGRKMGYAYEIYGTKGAIRFDQEDQNALWFYKGDAAPDRAGFTKILTGPLHPNYKAFCLGPGHGTGYQDQIIIEARDFLKSIETGTALWPNFADGMRVNQVVEAARLSHRERRWIDVEDL